MPRVAPLFSIALLLAAGPLAGEPLEVRGWVLAGTQPLPKARVALSRLATERERALAELRGEPEPPPVAQAASDEQGEFLVVAPEAGMWRLTISAPGFVPVERRLAPLLEPIDLPDAHLDRDTGLRVAVTDPAGKPVAGAWVEAVPPERERFGEDTEWATAPRRSRADERGIALLPHAEREELEVRAYAAGRAEAKTTSRAGAVALSLTSSAPRTLRVETPGKAPLAGALVLAGHGRWPLGLTGQDGRITLAPPRGEGPLAILAEDGAGYEGRFPAGGEKPEQPAVMTVPGSARLAGRVVDRRTRRPIPGALAWSGIEPARFARAAADGSFDFSLPALGQGWAGAGAAGYLPQRDFGGAAVDTPRSYTFALEAAMRLQGTVVDGAGGPVADAELVAIVDLLRSPRRMFGRRSSPVRARSRAGGQFELRGLAVDQAYELRVTRRGFAPLERDLDPLGAGAAPPLRLVLTTGASAVVRILGPGQRPLAGATARLEPTPESSRFWPALDPTASPFEATADFAGRALLRHVPTGSYELEIAAPGFATLLVPGLRIGQSAGEQDLGTVTLEPGVGIEGRVVDSGGRALGEAEVWTLEGRRAAYMGMELPEEPPGAITAADGFFRVEDRRAGERVDLLVARAGYGPEEVVGVEAPTPAPVRVVLQPALTVRGRVVDPDEKPIPGAQVVSVIERRSRRGQAMRSGPATLADAEGRFALEEVVPGALRLQVSAEGFQPAEVRELEVAAGRNLEGIEVVLEPGAAVAGRVLDADGEPAIGAIVEVVRERGPGSVFGHGAHSDGEGRYRLSAVAPGRRTLRAFTEDGRSGSRELEVRAGENELDLRLEGGVEVSGVVLDAGGAPVAGAEVQLLKPSVFRGFRRALTQADGSFTLSAMSDGQYRVSAAKEGYPSGRLDQPVSVEGAPVRGIEIRLPAGGAITGELRGLEFAELGRVHVMGAGVGMVHGRADAGGRYRLENVAPGEWEVEAVVDDRRASGRVRLEPGQAEAVLDLDFGEGLTLSGRVLRQSEAVAGAQIFLEGIDVAIAAGGRTTTDHAGAFRIENLSAGTYRLRVLLRGFGGGAAHAEELRLVEDQALTIELESGQIAGRVVDAIDGAALSGAVLTLEPAGAADRPFTMLDRHVSRSDARGRFVLRDVSPGTFRLRIEREGYAAEQRELAIAGGASEELEIALQPSEGLVLEVRHSGGGFPDMVRVALLDAAGRAIASGPQEVGEDGRVRLATAPPGSWELLLIGDNSAVAQLAVTVPGPPVPVMLLPGSALDVTVPALADSEQLAGLVLVDASGRPFRLPTSGGLPRQEFSLRYGRGEVQYLPPGTWQLTATDATGRVFRGTAQVLPGTRSEIALQ